MRNGNLPLIGVHQTHPSFLEAALEARRALTNATDDTSVNDAAARMVVQLYGLAECITNMAETGLVNVDITSSGLQTQTRCIDGQWHSHTRVLRLPPRMCSDIKLPPDFCNAIMQSLVIFSAVENDPNHELVEMREMAAMVASDWPELETSATGRTFAASMRIAWRNASVDYQTDSTNRLARALTERLHGDASKNVDTAIEYARSTLGRLAQSRHDRRSNG